jgi:hypothetical protein
VEIIKDLTAQLDEAKRRLAEFEKPKLLQITDGAVIEKINDISEDIIEKAISQQNYDYETAITVDKMCRGILYDIISEIKPIEKPEPIQTIMAEYDCFNPSGNLSITFISGDRRSTPVIHDNFKPDPSRSIDIQILEIAKEDLRMKYTRTKIMSVWGLDTYDNMQVLVFTDNPRVSQPPKTIILTTEEAGEAAKSDKKHRSPS